MDDRRRSADEAIEDFERKHADAQTIKRLAQLPLLEYQRCRKAEAKHLGCSVAALDELVASERDHGAQTAAGQGITFDEPPPSDDPVDGVELLDDLRETFSRYARLPQHGDTVLALWVVFTHLLDAVQVAPILALTSPEKRCGKTTVLAVMARLAFRRLPSASISPAALFRVIEECHPTLLIDEADAFLNDNEELRGILNSGHTRDMAFVIRTVGEDFEPRQFSTWSPKAIALIGKLPGTLHDRAIEVRLARRKPDELIEPLRHSNRDDWARLKARIARFAVDHRAAIAAARPIIPEQLHDRAADNWTPLLAIAEAAGGAWPGRARAAAIALCEADDSDALGIELLRDHQSTFNVRGKPEKIFSADLVEALGADPEKAWATIERGKPLTQHGLARRLRSFGIRPKTIRIGTTVAKGYDCADFAEPFARYLR